MAAAAVWQLELNGQHAKELARRSLAANGNSVWGLIVTALIEMTSGNPAEGLELLRRADRLSPRDLTGWLLAGGMPLAYYLEGRYEASIEWSQKALAQNPRYVVAVGLLAANYAQLGRSEKAAEWVQQLLKGVQHSQFPNSAAGCCLWTQPCGRSSRTACALPDCRRSDRGRP